jgi:mannose-6-phosphate isomerase-like protein (cupin superfamily)
VQKINILEQFHSIDEYWSPKSIGDLNDHHVVLAKLKGEFFWHKHDDEDELFIILKGDLIIKFVDREITLSAGDLAIIPKGVLHLPIAKEEVHVMLIEPKGTKSIPADPVSL